MKQSLRIATLAALMFSAAAIFAQSTTYQIGTVSCGVGSAVWVDCYSLPLTIGATTTTAWIEMDYPPNRAEEFIVFHNGAGDYETTGVQVVSTTNFCYSPFNNGTGIRCETLPSEATANLIGTDGTTGSGTLDLKLSYSLGKVNRYYWGPLVSSAGGEIVISQ